MTEIMCKNYIQSKETYDFIKKLSEYKKIIKLETDYIFTSPPILTLVMETNDGKEEFLYGYPDKIRIVYYSFGVSEPISLMSHF